MDGKFSEKAELLRCAQKSVADFKQLFIKMPMMGFSRVFSFIKATDKNMTYEIN
jgi:hypothetical protein